MPRASKARARRPGGMRARFKIWIVFGDQVKFGDGRAELLDLVDQLGSLKKAVAKIGMSYRNAWGYLRELEESAGFLFLDRTPGGGPGGGTRLTAKGRRFLARYRQFRQGLDEVVSRHFERSFRQR